MLEFLPSRRRASREEEFAANYASLMRRALSWTKHDRAQAEDLVHDIFIQYVGMKAEVRDPEKIPAYLHRMLEHLYLTRVRLAGRVPLEDLSLVDYDTAEWSLAQADRRALVSARYVLQRICTYACQRKNQSLSAGVLILRFFHGYYPSEIMAVAKLSRSAVDNYLRIARQEIALHLKRPEALVTMSLQPSRAENLQSEFSEDMLLDLRRFIFAHGEGDCWSAEQVAATYAAGEMSPLHAPQLAHLLSCASCLDHVNEKLGLPKLEERYPSDTIGRDSGGSDTRGGGGSRGTELPRFIKKAKKRLQATEEHRPSHLQIAVNGHVRTSQSVASEINELAVRLGPFRSIKFLEILSEQGVCLLYLAVDRSTYFGQEKRVSVPLSDGRSLEVEIAFELDATRVRVIYRDPLLATDALGEGAAAGPTAVDAMAISALRGEPSTPHEGWRILGRLRALRLWPSRPVIIAAALAVLCVAILLPVLRRPIVPTADALLQHAQTAALANLASDQVIHRTLQLEESGSTLSNDETQRIEEWVSTTHQSRRLYDAQGKLIAGEFDGKVYPAAMVAEKHPMRTLWQSAFDLHRLTALEGHAATQTVQVTDRTYTVAVQYGAQSETTDAALVLRRPDLHPLEESLTYSDERRARFVEVSYERMPLHKAGPHIFEPDPELTGDVSVSSAKRLLPHYSFTAASLETEIHVLFLLSQVGADMGNVAEVSRASDGRLNVSVLAETPEDQTRYTAALAPLRSLQGVHLDIDQPGSSHRRPRLMSSRSPLIIVDPTVDTIPLDQALRDAFTKQGVPKDGLDAAVRQFAEQTLADSLTIQQNAWALSQLADRFSPRDLRDLSSEAKIEWLQMMQLHAAVIHQQTVALQAKLQQVFPKATNAPPVTPFNPANVQEVATAAELVRKLASQNDQTIAAAFTLSPETAAAQRIYAPEFAQSLSELDALSATLSATAGSLEAAAKQANAPPTSRND